MLCNKLGSRQKKVLTLLFLLTALILSADASTNNEWEWAMSRANPERWGYKKEGGWGSPYINWVYEGAFTDVGAGVVSPPIVYKGMVFALNDTGTLFAFDEYTGDVLWTLDLSISEGGLCVGEVYASLRVEKRSDFFSFGELASSTIEVLFVGSIYGIDPYTGDLLWHNPSGSSGTGVTLYDPQTKTVFVQNKQIDGSGTPVKTFNATAFSAIEFSALDDQRYYLVGRPASGGGGLIQAYDKNTADILWTATRPSPFTHPLIVNEKLIIGDQGGYLLIYDAASGSLELSKQFSDYVVVPITDGSYLYILTLNSTYASNVIKTTFDGKVLWKKSYGSPFFLEAGSVGKYLFIARYNDPSMLGYNSTIEALDKEDGSLIWSLDVSNVTQEIALVKGALFFGAGDFYCIGKPEDPLPVINAWIEPKRVEQGDRVRLYAQLLDYDTKPADFTVIARVDPPYGRSLKYTMSYNPSSRLYETYFTCRLPGAWRIEITGIEPNGITNTKTIEFNVLKEEGEVIAAPTSSPSLAIPLSTLIVGTGLLFVLLRKRTKSFGR